MCKASVAHIIQSTKPKLLPVHYASKTPNAPEKSKKQDTSTSSVLEPQWEFQDPKMEVPYHIFGHILYVALKHRPYILATSILGSWNSQQRISPIAPLWLGQASELVEARPRHPSVAGCLQPQPRYAGGERI